MNLFSSFSRAPIGLDVGTRLIKAVQVGLKRGRSVVTASASIGRSTSGVSLEHDEVKRLARVLSQQGFAGRCIAMAVPSNRLMSSVIDMPPRESGAPYDAIATQEFARLQKQEPGRFELAWWDVPRAARASTARIMAVGCAHADSNPILDVFSEAGFDVVTMDSGLCAAVRACHGLLGPTASVSAVLDMGWESARLALVHGGVVVFERVLSSSGLAPLQAQVCKALGIEPAESDALVQSVGLMQPEGPGEDQDTRMSTVAPLLRPILMTFVDEVVDELVASFEYATHMYPDAETSRLALVGGGACVPGVVEYMDSRLDIEVVTPKANSSHTQPALIASALGLAGYGDQG